MTGPPASRLSPEAVSRGSRQSQPRESGKGKRVRIVGENDVLIDVSQPDRLGRYLEAPEGQADTAGRCHRPADIPGASERSHVTVPCRKPKPIAPGQAPPVMPPPRIKGNRNEAPEGKTLTDSVCL